MGCGVGRFCGYCGKEVWPSPPSSILSDGRSTVGDNGIAGASHSQGQQWFPPVALVPAAGMMYGVQVQQHVAMAWPPCMLPVGSDCFSDCATKMQLPMDTAAAQYHTQGELVSGPVSGQAVSSDEQAAWGR